jgi:peptidoglycan hydrolase-like protein with peptidoglycan-binding domain
MKPSKKTAYRIPKPVPVRRNFSALICTAVFTCMAAVGADPVAADETIGAAQRELKRQQYYAGEITNTLDAATAAAIRRFQVRRGLKITGSLDDVTLAVLATKEPGADEILAATADERPPAREHSQNIMRDDLDFLRELEAQGTLATPPPPVTTGLSHEATKRPGPVPAPSPHSQPESDRGWEQDSPVRVRNNPPPRKNLPATESAEASQPTNSDNSLSKTEVLEAIKHFTEAWQQPSPERELSFYASVVDYYGEGRMPHASIARDQRNYYRRWPEREFQLLGDPEIVRLGEKSATVRYRYVYALRNGQMAASGKAEHFVRLERQKDGLKVVSVWERKLTN